jgi:putative NADH-flavin reductase
MRVIVFGATGGTGRCLIEQGLQRGFEMTAFVRRPERARGYDPRVTLVRGDADAAAVANAIQDRDAALSGLGTRP